MSSKTLDQTPDGEFTVPDPELVMLGQCIRSEYLAQLKSKYGVTQRASKKHDWVWYRAAELAKSRDISAELFVAQQLEEMAVAGTFFPVAMTSVKLRTMADGKADDANELQKSRYYAQLSWYRQLLHVYQGRPLYKDMSIQLSAVVRYILAMQANDLAFATNLEGAVSLERQQYVAANELLEVAGLC